MAGKQKNKSTSWAISAGYSLGKGKGSLGAAFIWLTLFDVQSQIYIPMMLKGGSLGVGLSAGVTAATFSPTFFSTSKPLWADSFAGLAFIATAELTVVVGAGLTYVTFQGIDHDPYWLDIGGLEYGVTGGISAGAYNCSVYPDAARENDGCLIAPGGDPYCGGSSPSGNGGQTSAWQSGG